MNIELFPLVHERLLDLANSYCDCGWYGDKSECIGTSSRCPDCDEVTTLVNGPFQSNGIPGDDFAEELLAELSAQVIIFNRKFGHDDGINRYDRMFNAMLEIDLHGFMVFRVLDWKKFSGEGSDYYVIEYESINLNNPSKTNTAAIRDMLVDFSDMIEGLS